ncbi:hypothetical protein C2E23DRAFT_505964 [Lenzites betulinus]|nr:hypothetical protein C2E23DRAFT_505964 [Lenzites betulinus]
MSNQLDAAAAILETLRVATVNTATALRLTRNTTLDNVDTLGSAVDRGINGAYLTILSWINVLTAVPRTPLDDETADKAITQLSEFVNVYTDLMIELIEKHRVLTAENSPLAPDAVIIGERIDVFQQIVTSLLVFLRSFIPSRVNDINEQGRIALDASELAAARYPKPTTRPSPPGSDESAIRAIVGNLNIPEAPTHK